MKLYRTTNGVFVDKDGSFYLVSEADWDELVCSADLNARVRAATGRNAVTSFDPATVLAPVVNQEVWAAGVTYYRSRNARQRMSRGLQVLASYTWSHNLDISSDSNDGGYPVNAYNFRADYGNSNWDIRHRFVASVVYELPKLNGSNWLVRSVLGNWQVNDITTLQSGKPINVVMAADVASISRAGNQRPNLIGKPSANRDSSHLVGCIDVTAFAQPAGFTFGDAGRNILTGPKFLNTDISLFKNFPIRERMKFEFRAEFFNVFNHPQLANPEATITSFTPGSGSFGNVDSIVADNRDIQFGAKFIF